MPRRVVLTFTFLALTACFLSYKLGSTPSVFAKPRSPQQDMAGPPPLPTAPTTWVLWSQNAGGAASVTKPAGGAGVKHVATCVTATYSNLGAPSNELFSISLNDGSNRLAYWYVYAPIGSSNDLSLCDLNIVGSANTSMTLQIGGGANTFVAVDLVGYDAQ